MAITRLAQSNPPANTQTLLHSSSRNAIVSIIATNVSSASANITMWTVPSGAGSSSYVYHAFQSPLPGNNSLESFRFAMEYGDSLYVQSSTSFVSFSLNGIYESNGTSNITVASLSASPTSSVIGDVWVNNDNETVYFWDGSEWVSVVRDAISTNWVKTASGGETSVSGIDNNGSSLSYDPGFEQVFLNGVLLIRGSDYIATTGTSITGLLPLEANDIIQIVTYNVTGISNTYTQSQIDGKINDIINPFFLIGI